MIFNEVFENIFCFKDYVNVYILKQKDKAILIDFGSGEVLNHLSELGINNVDYVLHTHYHRDQCFGDDIAQNKGIKIGGPYKERKLFVEAEKFWESKSYYDIYYFKPTFFVSTKNILLDLTFTEGDTFEWGSYQFRIVETAGHTTGSISYLIEINGRNLAFTGDLIYSGGKIITYYDLQYYYNDNGETGIAKSLQSFTKLLEKSPDILLPSHGDIIQNPKQDINILSKKLEEARIVFCSKHSAFGFNHEDVNKGNMKSIDIESVFPHIYYKVNSFIVKAKNGNSFIIDFAGSKNFGFTIQELDKLFEKKSIKNINFVIPTHHHDDHIAGIPLLKKKFGTEIYALENMVDILENPTHYRLGCLIEQPIKVDRVLQEEEVFEWEGYRFKIFHFPGQTEYHMGLFGNIDGKSIFFVGDSLTQRSLVDRDIKVNCFNFCRLGIDVGYMKCADILLECNPKYLAIAHYGIIKINKKLLNKFKKFVSEFEPLISKLVPYENPNIGFDPNWISFKPIRIVINSEKYFNTNLHIRNYTKNKVEVKFALNLPKNWTAEPQNELVTIEANTCIEFPIKIFIPQSDDKKGRTVITADITWDGTKIGPFPDLMVDQKYEPQNFWRGWTPEQKSDLLLWAFKRIRKSSNFFK